MYRLEQEKNIEPNALIVIRFFDVYFYGENRRKESVKWIEQNKNQLLKGFYLFLVMKGFILNK
ncbi:hypothetical protein FOR86_19010 [Bacillus anthracis]|nr:hypothetical protein [Bacillus anthracis]MXR59185.1 hypothetical protein [Bacillus anthracis]